MHTSTAPAADRDAPRARKPARASYAIAAATAASAKTAVSNGPKAGYHERRHQLARSLGAERPDDVDGVRHRDQGHCQAGQQYAGSTEGRLMVACRSFSHFDPALSRRNCSRFDIMMPRG